MKASKVLAAAIVLTGAFGVAMANAQAPAPMTRPAPTAQPRPAPAAAAAGHYKTEAEAKSHCAGDTVVWLNTKSKIYHFAGAKTYGKTKEGAYMCQKEADKAGNRAAKGEKPKSDRPKS
jgi:hypothetical protein